MKEKNKILKEVNELMSEINKFQHAKDKNSEEIEEI